MFWFVLCQSMLGRRENTTSPASVDRNDNVVNVRQPTVAAIKW